MSVVVFVSTSARISGQNKSSLGRLELVRVGVGTGKVFVRHDGEFADGEGLSGRGGGQRGGRGHFVAAVAHMAI